MTIWKILRQDDAGDSDLVSEYDDRVEAMAHLLALRSGPDEHRSYLLRGPDTPACRTNRDLYQRLLGAAEGMDGQTLQEFLRAWWLVSRPLAGQERLELDTVAAMVTVAGSASPPPMRPEWRTTSYHPVTDPQSYADWEAIVLSQIADLADFADAGPLGEDAYFGKSAPRPPGCVRATDSGWYNFHPRGYLECGMAGSLGGWDEDDGIRQPVPGPVTPLREEPEPGERPVDTVSWADLADLAICGQEYE